MERIAKIFYFLAITAFPFSLHATEWTIGILALRGETATQRHWQPLVDTLNKTVADAHFRLQPLDLNGKREAVDNGTVQFVLTNQAQFVQLNSRYHLRWLASLRSGKGEPGESMATGSVILVRRDSPFYQAQDLAGRTLGAVDAQAFGGYLLGYRELQEEGLRVDEQMKVQFMGFPADALLYLLREDAVQAAIVPVCLLENMAQEGLIDKTLFRVLLQKTSSFPCMTSTALYPDWSFAALPGVEDRIADGVARALLTMPEMGLSHWGVPASTSNTETLLRNLNRHPEQQRLGQSLLYWLNQHRLALVGVLVLVALFIANYAWAMVLVKRRGNALEAATYRLRAQQQALEQARQMSMLGEMASGFAHELNQPLSAIRMYALGGLNHLSRTVKNDPLEKALTNIESQAERCGLIIRHLRAWASPQRHATDSVEASPCDAADTCRQVLALLQLDQDSPDFQIQMTSAQAVVLCLPPVLLEQVLTNIILNAVQAGASRLWIDFSRDSTQQYITLQDNAGGIPAEHLSELFRPFYSTKQTGMGLGLVICQRLLRSVNSEISIHNHSAPDGSMGVQVTLTFPAGEHHEILQ